MELMRSGSDPSDRAMRIRSKPVKYVLSDEEMESGSDSGEEFGIPPKAVKKVPRASKPLAKPPKVTCVTHHVHVCKHVWQSC